LRNTIISSIRQGIRNAIESVVSALAPIFYWPGTHTLEATTGTDPTFTRATAATFEDFEGVIRTVESSEPRFQGARRVENLLVASEDFTNSAWLLQSGAAKVGTSVVDGVTAMEVSFGATAASIYASSGIPTTAVRTATFWVRAVSGATAIRIGTGEGFSPDIAIDDTKWWPVTRTASAASVDVQTYLRSNAAGTTTNVYIYKAQVEDVTGQTNQNPSEYVSTGVATGPELFTPYATVTAPWVYNGGSSYSIDGSQSGAADLTLGVLPTVGLSYELILEASNVTGTTFMYFFNGSPNIYPIVNGTNKLYVSSAASYNIIRASAGATITIDSISVKQASHGANVDGVQYFNTLNANTVTANVVTEAVGSPLTRANTQFGELMAAGDYFSTPNVVTTWGELDLRARATRSGGAYSFFVGKDQGARAFQFYLTSSNILGLLYNDSAGGLHQTPNVGVAPPFAIGELGWFRVTLETTTGDIKFYYADGNLEAPAISDYTQLGATQNLGVNDIRVTTGPFFAGAYGPAPSTYPFDGRIYRSQVYNEIDGTTPVVDFDFGDYVSGSTWVGIPYGPELVTNGDAFTGATGTTPPDDGSNVGWYQTSNGTYSVASGRLTLTLGTSGRLGFYFAIPTVIGKSYFVETSGINDGNSGTGQMQVRGTSAINPALLDLFKLSSTTASSATFVATTTTSYIGITNYATTNGAYSSIDSVSVKENQIFTLEGNASVFQPPVDESGPFGYLAEKASTNLMLQSEDFTTSWGANAGALSTVSEINPEGTASVTKITATTATTEQKIYQSFVHAAGSYSLSCYVKDAGIRYVSLMYIISGDTFQATFDLQSGTLTASQGTGSATLIGATITLKSNGWYKISVSGISANTSGYFWVNLRQEGGLGRPSFLGDGTSGVYIWGAQLEKSTYPTSYIATTTTAVTRNADVLIAGDMVTDAAGSGYAESSSIWTTSPLNNFLLTRDANGRILYANSNQPSTLIRGYAGTTIVLSPVGTSYQNRPAPMASTWGNNLTVYKDGVGGTAGSYNGTMGTGNLGIGNDNSGGFQWDGTVREVKIFDSELTAEEVGDL